MPTALVAVTHQVLLVDIQRLAHVPIGQVEQWPQTQTRPAVRGTSRRYGLTGKI
jgi:hypothetical protein